MKKKVFIVFLIIGALSMMVMSTHYLFQDHSGILRKKEVASNLWYLVVFRTHVFLGLVAIACGPFQFIKSIRKRYTSVHKVVGYTYAMSVWISSLSGLLVAPFAMGGWITATGFTTLAIAWFLTTIRTVIAIRNGDINTHKKWSYLSYALTFAAITQRTLLLIPLLTNVPFMPIYQLSAWLPWILNLMIANRLIKSSNVHDCPS